MANRIKGYEIVLDEAYHPDDAVFIAQALEMVKGVLSVRPIERSLSEDAITESRVRQEIAEKLDQIASELRIRI